ncbi:MAG: rod shape-determining protein MreC, partial [Thermoanaerobaculia bacterium]
MAPVTGFVTWVGSSVTGFSEDMALRRTLLAENLRLREEVGELREQSIRNFGLKEDLDHLARALTYTRAFEAELQAADLVYVDYASWLQTAVLRTAADTVRVNQPVVSGKGLVGRIVLVTGPYAKVQLITDRAASVGAMIERTRRQ